MKEVLHSIQDIQRKDATVLGSILMELSRDGIAILSNYRLLACNDTFARMLGYAQDELCGMPAWTWDAQLTEEQIYTTFSNPGTIDTVFETRHRRKDGTVYDVEISARGTCVAGQDLVVAICRDISERKKSEGSLCKTEELLQSISRLSRIGGWGKNLLTGEDEWSEVTREIHEVGPDFVPTMQNAIDFYREGASRDTIMKAVTRCVETGAPYDVEVELITARGNLRWIRTQGNAECHNGQCVRLYGTFQDITAHKQVEQALQESQAASYRSLFDDIPNTAVQGYTLDGTTIYWNRASENLYGYSAAEALGRNILELIIPPEMHTMVTEAIASMAATGRPFPAAEVSLMRKDGTRVPVYSSHALTRKADGGMELFCIDLDLSERRRIEEALLAQQQFQKLIADIASDFITVNMTCLDEKIRAGIQRMGEFFDLDRSDVLLLAPDYSTISKTHEWCRKGVASQLGALQNYPLCDAPWYAHQILEQRAVVNIPDVDRLPPEAHRERVLLQKLGIQSTLAVPIYTAGRVYGAIGCDAVTRCRHWSDSQIDGLRVIARILANALTSVEAEEKLMALKLQAEAATRAKSEFLANMSHEIRTPLNVVLGFAHLLAEDTRLTHDQAQHVQTILSSGRHLLELLSDILDMSRIETGCTSLRPQDFDIATLLAELRSLFQSIANIKELDFQVTSDSRLPPRLHGDADKLRQILVNLLSNALKFTSAGQVGLHLQHEPDSTSDKAENLRLVAEVRDTGPGIAPLDQEHIFDAFQQTARGMDAGGTGLGLAISRRFAQLMGGKLTVSSRLEAGSCFRLEIPLQAARSEAPVILPPHGELKSGTGPWRILAVDDQPENRRLLTILLQSSGCEVREAADGLEALQLFESWQPQAVLLDMLMPGMDGYETARRIRSTPAGRHTLLVAVTAGVLKEDRQKSLAAGVDIWIIKPFHHRELLAILKQNLEQRYGYGISATSMAATAGKSGAASVPAVPDLPVPVMQSFHQALIRGDIIQITRLIDNIAPQYAEFARHLRDMAYNFDYAAMASCLKFEYQVKDCKAGGDGL